MFTELKSPWFLQMCFPVIISFWHSNMPHSYTQWSHLWLEEDSPLFMVCKVIFSMLRLISDNPCCCCSWTLRCCCDCPRLSELLLGIPELDLKSDLLPLNLLVALANRLLMTSPSSWSPTPMAAATAICRGEGRNLNMGWSHNYCTIY